YNVSTPTAAAVVARYQEYGCAGGNEGFGPIADASRLYTLPRANLGHRSASGMAALTQDQCLAGGRDLVWWGHVVGPISNDSPKQQLSVSARALKPYLGWLAQQVSQGRLIVDTCRNVVHANLLG